jgi:hypothetical protein
MLCIRTRSGWWATTLAAAGLLLSLIIPRTGASAQTQSLPEDVQAQLRAIKEQQRQILMAGPLRHLKHNREYAEAVRKAERRHKPIPPRGAGLKKAPTDVDDVPMMPEAMPRFSVQGTAAAPTNVRCNNPASPTLDGASDGQAEQSIAAWGPYALAAWNDGSGFTSPPGPDVQGYGYSLDGGATWTDGGMVPKPSATFTWTSDPVVTVNEKTGEFWYCGLLDSTAAYSGIGVVKATLTPSGITWGTLRVPTMLDNTNYFIDKQWCVVDSLNGNLYVTYTKFTAIDDTIMFVRSTDGGVTWNRPQALSDPLTAGFQQGSRPVVGPNGEVYVIWSEIGPVDADFCYLRKSTNQGVSFAAQVEAVSTYNNFGTGAPGFNRERSVDFPAIAVDRTTGPNRGRVYVSWHQSVNWYSDALGGSGSKSEVEPDNTFSTATLFTPGNKVRGAFSSSSDTDWFKFNATQGNTYVFWVDSIPRPLYSFRIFCTDGTTRLTYTGDLSTPAGGKSFTVFTAPATATYYVRMFYSAGGATGGYRIQTGVHVPGIEAARDQRDVFVRYSDGGATWSSPIRVNDDPAWFDDWLPEVAVGADGMPYVLWYDWRDATANCGGSSQIYVSRSTDGGATWQPSQPASSAASPWTSVSSNIAPNQGDYNAITADDRYVRPAWADGRSGNADVYTTAIDTWFLQGTCPRDTSLHGLDVLGLPVQIQNLNPLFANDYSLQVTTDRGWPAGPATPLNAIAGGISSTSLSLAVPDTAAAGVVHACVVATNAKGTITRACCFNLTVLPSAGVEPQQGDVFALSQNFPNPLHGEGTRIGFSLPVAGHARLEVFSVGGQRVRTVADGTFAAGPNSVAWDGRDDRGNAVRAGTYFYRLTAPGHSAVKRMVVLP